MKTLRLLAATVLSAWASVAAAAWPPAPPASLTVYSEQGQPFGFVLDGRALTRPLARQVRVGLLPPGQHWADVSVPTPYGRSLLFRTSLWLRPGLDNGYVLVLRPGGPQLRPLAPGLGGPGFGGPAYGGGQYPPAGGAPGQYPAPGQYDNSDDYDNDAAGQPGPAGPGYPGGGYPGTPAPGGAYPSGSGAGQPTSPGSYPNSNGYPNGGSYPATPGNNYPNGGGYPAAPGTGYQPAPGRSGYPGNAPYLQPLAPADFSGLQQALARRPFDDERLSIAKQALGQRTVRADELATLVRALSFDKSRIELAEFGYGHLADPQNFYRVYDALQYRSSIQEVQQALGLPQN